METTNPSNSGYFFFFYYSWEVFKYISYITIANYAVSFYSFTLKLPMIV